MKTLKDNLELLRSQLLLERSSFDSHWKDLSDFIEPRRSRFTISDQNKGDRRNKKIIDSTATLSRRTLQSGMMAGLTSPARPWFKLTTPDPDLAEFGTVKNWLAVVEQRMRTRFLRSNLYKVLPSVYGDIGTFGTSAWIWESDPLDLFRGYVFPIGSYCIANDERQRVAVFMRDFRMTVRQVVEKFGRVPNTSQIDWSKMSLGIKDRWDKSDYESWVDICHVIRPNPDYNPKLLDSRFKKFQSVYYERGMGSNQHSPVEDRDKYLRVSGYDFFPVFAPRWSLADGDVYATECPAMVALGDIRQLQLMQRRKGQAVDKMVNPPMTAPASMKNSRSSIASGDITYLSDMSAADAFRPAHEVRFPLAELREDIADTRSLIQRAFFEDLFLMLANSDRRQITAREIEERHEEKLLAIGPVLEQVNDDMLNPLIDNSFIMMEEAGEIPPPPPELEGVDLKIEYISIMAQAQKLVGIGSVERMAQFSSQIAAVDPRVLDKINTDQMIDVMGDLLSVPPNLVRTDEEVAEIRAGREQAAQQQAQAEQQAMLAQEAKTLSETNLDGNNALNELLARAESGEIGDTTA